MQIEEMITASEFCRHHNIELSFIYSLQDSGLLQTETIGESVFLPVGQLSHLEKLVKWHYEMDINIAGLETITHLLGRLDSMHHQIINLSNRLNRYEGE
jgi:MerR HTH family regulatory protein